MARRRRDSITGNDEIRETGMLLQKGHGFTQIDALIMLRVPPGIIAAKRRKTRKNKSTHKSSRINRRAEKIIRTYRPTLRSPKKRTQSGPERVGHACGVFVPVPGPTVRRRYIRRVCRRHTVRFSIPIHLLICVNLCPSVVGKIVESLGLPATPALC